MGGDHVRVQRDRARGGRATCLSGHLRRSRVTNRSDLMTRQPRRLREGTTAHDRPNGIAEDEFKKSQLPDATDKSSWKVIVAAKEADTQSGSKGGKGGKGSKGGRGSLGGKGGKGGKSGKGGKGSGSRGINKTGQRFHRP